MLFILKKKKKKKENGSNKKKKKKPVHEPILHQMGKEKKNVMEDSGSGGPQFLKNFMNFSKDYFHMAASDI